MKNEQNYARYWIAVILAAMIMSLMGCASSDVTYTEIKTAGGCFVQSDSIVNGDTLSVWRALK